MAEDAGAAPTGAAPASFRAPSTHCPLPPSMRSGSIGRLGHGGPACPTTRDAPAMRAIPSPRSTRRVRRLATLVALAVPVAPAVAVAAVAALPAALPAQATAEPPQPRPPISFGPALERAPGHADSALAAVYERIADGFRRRDVDHLAAAYAADAHYLLPGDSLIHGRDAIRERYRWFLRPTPETGAAIGPLVRFEILDRVVADSTGWDVGYVHYGPPDAEQLARTASLFVLWRRTVDGWRIAGAAIGKLP